jgi:hypothetical protein
MTPQGIVEELEELEAQDASSIELDRALVTVTDPGMLWEVAECAPLSVAIIGAIYRRAEQIGASWDTARGYLALAHLFEGDSESAVKLVGPELPRAKDPVLLDAWTALAATPEARVERLKQALTLAPDSLRRWRAMATEALRAQEFRDARRAHEWLAANEKNPRERERVQDILREYGWTS